MRRPMRRRHSVSALRSTPSTYSMTMKYVSSECPMSNTCTMFACCSASDSRASSRNIATNFLFLVRFGRIRLMAMFFRKPCIDSATPRKTSAIPPAATRSVIRYRLSGLIAGSFGNYNRWPAAAISPRRPPPLLQWYLARRSVLEAARALRLSIAKAADLREPAPAGLLGRGLLALTLFLAIDAQRRHRPREQAPKRYRLTALL